MDYCVAENIDDAKVLLERGGLSHSQIADTLLFLRKNGLNPTKLQQITGYRDYTVRHYQLISQKLVVGVKNLLHKKQITFAMARVIASLPQSEQEEQARKAIMTGTSVKQMRDKIRGEDRFCDEETKRYFERLAMIIGEQTGLVVTISPENNNKHAGIIQLRYTDLTDFDSVCSRLKVDLCEF